MDSSTKKILGSLGILMVVGIGLAAVQDAAPAVAPAAADSPVKDTPADAKPTTSVSLSGPGAMSTDPFMLGAGDYRVTWDFPEDCYYGAMMKPLDDENWAEDLRSADGPDSGMDNVYEVGAGEWYVEVFTGSECAWELTLEPR